MWELDHREGWGPKNWCFELLCWRRLLRVPWTARKPYQSILNIHWKDWCWSSNTLATWCKKPTLRKNPDGGKDWRQEEKGTMDEMVEWHHRLSGHEFEQAPGDGEVQEAWHAAVHGVTKSQTQLSNWITWHFLLTNISHKGKYFCLLSTLVG